MALKVIAELATYLIDRGLLSDDDIQRLDDRGLIDRDEPLLPNEHSDPEDFAPPDDLDPNTYREPTSTRGGGRGPRPPKVTAEDLERWIAANLDRWSHDVRALDPVARSFADLDAPHAAPRILSSRAIEELEPILESALAARKPSLDELWTALEWGHPPSPFGRASGPVGAALKRALDVSDRTDLGAYAWILKQPGIRWLYHLARTQRALLRALANMATSPARLAPLLADAKDDGAGLALALVYTARNKRRRGIEDAPVRGDALSFRPAIWAAAMQMEAGVANLFRALIDRPSFDAVKACTFDRDAHQLITLHNGGRVAAWDDTTGAFAGLLAPTPPFGELFAQDVFHLKRMDATDIRTGKVAKLVFSPARKLDYATGTFGASDKNAARTILSDPTSCPSARGFAGKTHFVPMRGRLTERWQAAVIPSIAPAHFTHAGCAGDSGMIIASASGRVLAAVGSDQIAVWDVELEKLVQRRKIDAPGYLNWARISADGRFVAVNTYSSSAVQIFDLTADSHALVAISEGHLLRHAALSPRGRWMITVNQLEMLRLWELDLAAKKIHSVAKYLELPKGIGSRATVEPAITFSGDEERVAIIYDGVASIAIPGPDAKPARCFVPDAPARVPEVWRGKWWYRHERATEG